MLVVTRIPSAIAVVQAGNSWSVPSTSTTHTRHEPVSDRPREVAHRRDRDPVLARDVEDRLALGARDVDAVDLEREDGHAALPPPPIGQTPAGQARSTMWAVYSSRK